MTTHSLLCFPTAQRIPASFHTLLLPWYPDCSTPQIMESSNYGLRSKTVSKYQLCIPKLFVSGQSQQLTQRRYQHSEAVAVTRLPHDSEASGMGLYRTVSPLPFVLGRGKFTLVPLNRASVYPAFCFYLDQQLRVSLSLRKILGTSNNSGERLLVLHWMYSTLYSRYDLLGGHRWKVVISGDVSGCHHGKK